MDFQFSVITGKVIHSILNENKEAIFSLIKDTYKDHSREKTINPNSYFLRFPTNPKARIIALPAAIDSEQKISGIKWISSYPDNIKHGFPRASAVIILNDFETGYPLACLEGSIISATRTAYSAVLAAEVLHPSFKKIACLGIVGNGFIAKYIYACFQSQGWEIGKIVLFDLDKQSSTKLQTTIQQDFEGDVTLADSHQQLIESSDLVVFATTVAVPYVDDPALFNNKQTVLNVSLRDLSPDILMKSNNIVDDSDHVLTANTSPHLTYLKYNTKDFINGTIGDYLINKFPLDATKPIIFSPMGMGILDIAISHYIYRHQTQVHYVDDFFYDLN